MLTKNFFCSKAKGSLGSQPWLVPRTSTWAPRDTPFRATSGCVSLSFQFRTEKANTHIHTCTQLDPLNPQANRSESERLASGLKKEKSNNLWMQTKLNHSVPQPPCPTACSFSRSLLTPFFSPYLHACAFFLLTSYFRNLSLPPSSSSLPFSNPEGLTEG